MHAWLLMYSFCSGVWLRLQRSTGASWMRDPKGMLFLRLIEAVNGEALACMGAAPLTLSRSEASRSEALHPKQCLLCCSLSKLMDVHLLLSSWAGHQIHSWLDPAAYLVLGFEVALLPCSLLQPSCPGW